MKLVIPVSKSDRELIPNLYAAFGKYEIGSDHDLLVVGSHEVQADVDDIIENLRGKFDTVDKLIIKDSNLGWPMACNHYFQQACYHLNKGDDDAFVWFELDTTPICDHWLDIINKEYYDDTTRAVKAGREPLLYLGAKERSYEGRNGELLPESIAGSRMAPVGVYSTDICSAPVLSSLAATTRHWSSVIQWYTVPSLANSWLIQNNWRTKNYRKENGVIVCDSIANLAWGVHFNNPVSENAVLVHGCKDGSLLQVLLDNNVDKDMKVATQVSIEDAEQIAEEFEEREERAERKQSKHKPKSFFSMFKERNAKDEE
jgi:predicted nucleotidyltransferase